MFRATVAVVLLGALVLTGCTADVVDGRAVSQPSASRGTVPQSGARFTDTIDIARLMSDVSRGVAAVNTYDYRSLDAALANGLRYTTGKFSDDLRKTYRTVIAKNATSLRASQRAKINNVGVASLSGTSASLLVYGQLNIRTKDTPTGRVDPFAVVARAQLMSGQWRLVQLAVNGTVQADPPGTAQLGSAIAAARTTATTLFSFRRATFEADYDRALAMVTSGLRPDLEKNRSTTLRALLKGGFDLTADVRAVGVEVASGTRVIVLVALDGYRIRDGVKQDDATMQNLRMTVVLSGGRWLVEAIDSVGIS